MTGDEAAGRSAEPPHLTPEHDASSDRDGHARADSARASEAPFAPDIFTADASLSGQAAREMETAEHGASASAAAPAPHHAGETRFGFDGATGDPATRDPVETAPPGTAAVAGGKTAIFHEMPIEEDAVSQDGADDHVTPSHVTASGAERMAASGDAPSVTPATDPDGGISSQDTTHPELSEIDLTACLRLVEALVFASVEPVRETAIRALLAGQGLIAEDASLAPVMAAFVARYDDAGVEPVEVAGGWQFRTRPDLARALTRVIERPRRLGRSAMETLAVIAYHQPCTRTDVEAIRGVALSQNVLDALLEDSLIVPRGRKEVPGRPVLWGTGTSFLQQFGLRDLGQLPRREELLLDVPNVAPVSLLDTRPTPPSDEDAAGETVSPDDAP